MARRCRCQQGRNLFKLFLNPFTRAQIDAGIKMRPLFQQAAHFPVRAIDDGFRTGKGGLGGGHVGRGGKKTVMLRFGVPHGRILQAQRCGQGVFCSIGIAIARQHGTGRFGRGPGRLGFDTGAGLCLPVLIGPGPRRVIGTFGCGQLCRQGISHPLRLAGRQAGMIFCAVLRQGRQLFLQGRETRRGQQAHPALAFRQPPLGLGPGGGGGSGQIETGAPAAGQSRCQRRSRPGQMVGGILAVPGQDRQNAQTGKIDLRSGQKRNVMAVGYRLAVQRQGQAGRSIGHRQMRGAVPPQGIPDLDFLLEPFQSRQRRRIRSRCCGGPQGLQAVGKDQPLFQPGGQFAAPRRRRRGCFGAQGRAPGHLGREPLVTQFRQPGLQGIGSLFGLRSGFGQLGRLSGCAGCLLARGGHGCARGGQACQNTGGLCLPQPRRRQAVGSLGKLPGMAARGRLRLDRLLQPKAAVFDPGRILDLGDLAPHVPAARHGVGQIPGQSGQFGLAARQGLHVLFGPREGAARLWPSGGRDEQGQILAGARQRPVHSAPAGQGLDFPRDRGHQVTARGPGAVEILRAALIQGGHALPHPEQARRTRLARGLGQPGDPGFRLVRLGDKPVALIDFGQGPRQPLLDDPEAALGDVNLHLDPGYAAGLRFQRADLFALRAVRLKEQGLQGIEQGRFAVLVRGAKHVQTGADALNPDRPGKAADVMQRDRDQPHVRSSFR